jgi:hypothetical protein
MTCPLIPLGFCFVFTEISKDSPIPGFYLPEEKGIPKDARLEVVAVGDKCEYLRIGDHIVIGEGVPVRRLTHDDVKYWVTEEEFVSSVWRDSRE